MNTNKQTKQTKSFGNGMFVVILNFGKREAKESMKLWLTVCNHPRDITNTLYHYYDRAIEIYNLLLVQNDEHKAFRIACKSV